MKGNQLQTRIMRRVYYAFVLRVATHPLLVHALVVLLSVYALSRLTHVAAIMNNLRSIRVGELDTYLLNSIMHAEFVTLVCVGIVVFSLLSLPLRLSLPKRGNMQMA
jgi:hypothetical protein